MPLATPSVPVVRVVTPTPHVRAGAWTPWSRRTWLATAHLVLDLPVGMLWGTSVVALVAASVGLLPLALLGIALLVLTLAGSLLAASVERHRGAALLGTPSSGPTSLPRSWSAWLRLLVDGRAWRSVVYGVVLLPLGIVNATVVLTGWSLVLAGLSSQAWAWLLPSRTVVLGSWSLEGEAAVILTTVLAAVLCLAMPVVVRALTAVDRWLLRTLVA
ncbi:MAG: hypothetical protein GC157_16395 [Frankiales bacterium]|nr:hypothetical protein [Frankiales bacterium]